MSIQLKRSLTADIDPEYVLKQGQLGIDMPSDTNSIDSPFNMKIGDGATVWENLPYLIEKDTTIPGFVNITSLGYVPNSGEDVVPYLKQIPNYSNVIFPKGTYTLNSNSSKTLYAVVFAPDVKFTGEGKFTISQARYIFGTPGGTYTFQHDPPSVALSNISDIYLSGTANSFNGQMTTCKHICGGSIYGKITSTSSVMIENATIQSGSVFDVQSKLTFRNCTIYGSIDSSSSNCTVYDNCNFGTSNIYLNSPTIIISNCIIPENVRTSNTQSNISAINCNFLGMSSFGNSATKTTLVGCTGIFPSMYDATLIGCVLRKTDPGSIYNYTSWKIFDSQITTELDEFRITSLRIQNSEIIYDGTSTMFDIHGVNLYLTNSSIILPNTVTELSIGIQSSGFANMVQVNGNSALTLETYNVLGGSRVSNIYLNNAKQPLVSV